MADYANKLIMNNNLYYVADEVLEAELDELEPVVADAQNEANVGKEAIIDATELKTGKEVSPRTYGNVVSMLDNISPIKYDFDTQPIVWRYYGSSTLASDTNWFLDSDFWFGFGRPYQDGILKTPVRTVFNYPRLTIPSSNADWGFTLSAQCLVDIPEDATNVVPIVLYGPSYYTGYNAMGIMFEIVKDSNSAKIMYQSNSSTSYATETITYTGSVIGKKFFELNIDYTVDSSTKFSYYMADAVENKQANSGYSPSNKTLLYQKVYPDTAGYYIAYWINKLENNSSVDPSSYSGDQHTVLECGGIGDSKNDFITTQNTAVNVNAQTIGLSYVSKADSSRNITFGKTDMIDMEVS